MRTRSGRGGTTTATPATPQKSPSKSPTKTRSAPPLSRMATRSSSNISTYSQIYVGGQSEQEHVQARWKKPFLTIFGLRPEHFERFGVRPCAVHELEMKELPQNNQPLSPILTEEGEGESRQESTIYDALERALEQEIKNAGSRQSQKGHLKSTPIPKSPLSEMDKEDRSEYISVEKGEFKDESAEIAPDNSQKTHDHEDEERDTDETRRALNTDVDGGNAAMSIENDNNETIMEAVLADADLPSPFGSRQSTLSEDDVEDQADFIVKTRFLPMTDPQRFINALTKLPPSARSTEVLYALALNTQKALKAWQDEYILLDKKTAPHTNPPKKPATGGRIPLDPVVYEEMKEADLYNYAYDAKKPPGQQNPYTQRLARDAAGGRELRQRRARDGLGELMTSDEEGLGKRKRKAVVRYDGVPGAAGRKRGLVSQTPDVEGPRKRGRPSAGNYLPQRIREMRAQSVVTTTSEEEEEDGSGAPDQSSKRRGRPPGIKNSVKRSDAGVKKGPQQPSEGKPEEQQVLQNGDSRSSGNIEPGQSTVSAATMEDPFITSTQQYTSPWSSQPAPLLPQRTYGASPYVITLPNPPPPPPPLAQISLSQPSLAADYNTLNPLSRAPGPTTGTPTIPIPTAIVAPPPQKRKQRVKSEKRSQSMTAWWAERKAKQQEQKLAELRARAAAGPQPNNAAPSTIVKPAPVQSMPAQHATSQYPRVDISMPQVETGADHQATNPPMQPSHPPSTTTTSTYTGPYARFMDGKHLDWLMPGLSNANIRPAPPVVPQPAPVGGPTLLPAFGAEGPGPGAVARNAAGLGVGIAPKPPGVGQR